MHETLATITTSRRANSAGGGGVAQAVDLLVDRRVLLDVEVLGRDVGLGLVVVVVGDEVLHGVAGEVGAELVAQLRGQRLVVGDDQRRPLDGLDRRRHRHRLAGTGRAEQRLEALAGLDPLGKGLDGRRLIGGRDERAVKLECGHPSRLVPGAGGPVGRPRSAVAELAGVCVAVVVADAEHAAHVGAGLGKRDLVDGQRRPRGRRRSSGRRWPRRRCRRRGRARSMPWYSSSR